MYFVSCNTCVYFVNMCKVCYKFETCYPVIINYEHEACVRLRCILAWKIVILLLYNLICGLEYGI